MRSEIVQPGRNELPAWEERRDPARLNFLIEECRSRRKLHLLFIAAIRYAPFHIDGRTIWEMLPALEHFTFPNAKPPCNKFNLHDSIKFAERYVDGFEDSQDAEVLRSLPGAAEYCAVTLTPPYSYPPERLPHPEWWYIYYPICAVQVAAVQHRLDRLRKWDLGLREAMLEVKPEALHPANGEVICSLIRDSLLSPQRRRPFRPSPATKRVRGLAESMYEERCFDRMPELAMELETAGVADQAMLRHCREPGLHARGCWAVDRMLGLDTI